MTAQKKTRHEDEPAITFGKVKMNFLSKLRYIYYHRLNNTSRVLINIINKLCIKLPFIYSSPKCSRLRVRLGLDYITLTVRLS